MTSGAQGRGGGMCGGGAQAAGGTRGKGSWPFGPHRGDAQRNRRSASLPACAP